MIKKSWIIGVGLVTVLGGAGAAFAAGAPIGDYIGKAKAKQIALQEVPGTVTDVDLERHGGTAYYEVDIDRKDSFREADVYIDALTGKVLRVVEDDDDDYDDDRRSAAASSTAGGQSAQSANEAAAAPSGSGAGSAATASANAAVKPSPGTAAGSTAGSAQASASPSSSTANGTAGASAAQITSERAVEIAKEAVQGEGELIRVKTDRDDGRLEYEVKLMTANGTAEVEIAAATGKVLDVDYDNGRDDDDDWDDDDRYDNDDWEFDDRYDDDRDDNRYDDDRDDDDNE